MSNKTQLSCSKQSCRSSKAPNTYSSLYSTQELASIWQRASTQLGNLCTVRGPNCRLSTWASRVIQWAVQFDTNFQIEITASKMTRSQFTKCEKVCRAWEAESPCHIVVLHLFDCVRREVNFYFWYALVFLLLFQTLVNFYVLSCIDRRFHIWICGVIWTA